MRSIYEVFINNVCLPDILKNHERWLNHEEDGERANLSGADLTHVDLSYVVLTDARLRGSNLNGADLSCVDLNFADLNYANLEYAYLRDVNLECADLSYANLSGANLSGADLTGVNLNHSNLSGANLRGADLTGVNLGDSNLTDARLSGANLSGVEYNTSTPFFALQCPEKGSFIGYKKARGKIVELLITEDSKRSSATSRKCRCSKAKVLSITNIDNTEEYNKVASSHDKSFIYKIGEIVEVKDFDEDRWNECSTGIHFFLTRDEAVRYLN